MRSRLLALTVLALGLAVVPSAAAKTYLPPGNSVLTGVAMGENARDYQARVGKHPALFAQFTRFGAPYHYIFDWADETRSRPVLAIGASAGQNLPESVSPGEISRGAVDRYVIGLAGFIAQRGKPAYIRLMAEQNNCDLPYAAYDCAGRRRDADHTAGRWIMAYRRVVLIMRGGSVDHINRRLARQQMPAIRTSRRELPKAPVGFMWSPMTGGSPMISGLDPQRTWPGSEYVDIVTTSFYSRFATFRYLEPFYERFAVGKNKPFGFGEWAMWGSDDAGFARTLFSWVARHPRGRVMIYNQGKDPAGPFRLRHYPSAARVIKASLASGRFAAFAPEFAR